MDKKISIMFIMGTRPEVIKLSPIILEAKKHKSFNVYICSTGQHKEMLKQALNSFELLPDIDLELMSHNQTLSGFSSRAIIKIDNVLIKIKPDIVLVQGDTTTSFIGALAAFYRNVKIGHVEAGLRTHNKLNPFPEEMNRRLTADLADFHFAPTKEAKIALMKENISRDRIWVCGNTVVDAIEHIKNISLKMTREMFKDFPNPIINNVFEKDKDYILITCHRRENFGKALENICNAIKILSQKYPSFNFIFPVHFNPNVKKIVNIKLGSVKNIFLIDPIGYKKFVRFMATAKVILTDSGGIQEEVFSLNIPTLVMRNNTERFEGLNNDENNTLVKLVGTGTSDIVSNVRRIIEDGVANPNKNVNPYGDGKASKRILKEIENKLSKDL